MRKIINPFIDIYGKEYHCFGCSPHNTNGLHLDFWEDGDELIAYIKPNKNMEGYHNVIHGGIQATLHDEVAAWYVYAKCGTSGVTAELKVTYRKPALMDLGDLILKGRLIEKNRRFAVLHTQLLTSDNVLLSEATVKYFIFPENIAKEKYNYPGIEAFHI